ncbi:MAG: TIGR00730 family Rossman fold protein [Bacteroidota bacterium]
MKSIVVFCGSSEGKDPKIIADAAQLGYTLAEQNIKLIYGGASVGVMGHMANACLDGGGQVIGVIPDFLMRREIYHTRLTELIITRTMHERKLKMYELSDGVIMLPGGFGTLEEFFEMITWGQLGLHKKPIGILNTNGFYDELLAMLRKMITLEFLKQENYEMIQVDSQIEGLLQKMNDYTPLALPKWLKKGQV